ncbi:MAG: FAD-dependent monooxygenase [Dehalococcoidia bacterium]
MLRIAIVGGGIGGLTAALALRRAGFDAHVYEQASVLREVGAGVQSSPNAVKVLQSLGLAEPLGRIGVTPLSIDSRDWQTGEVLGRVPLAEAALARYGAPYYHLHRADLHDVLRAALGDEQITLGAKCIAVVQHDAEVTARFADGRSANGDLLIGADGVHSVVRDYVAGPDKAVWSRQIAWRGLVPAEVGARIGLERRSHSFWGPERQFITYYVASGRMVNWVGNVKARSDWQEESWSTRGDRNEALAEYGGWHEQVRALIANTDQVFKWALFDRPPLEAWTRGRVALLGDAAHAMLPYLAQGAGQSIEDAFVLARCLEYSPDDPEQALLSYVSRRKERTAAMQAGSREAGRTMHLADLIEVAARNMRMRSDPDAHTARYDWIYGYDVNAAMQD